MTRTFWWWVDIVSRMLEPGEREAALGDIVERRESSVEALRDLLGLVIRRQAILWKDWRPWLALFGLAVPLGMLLCLVSKQIAHSSAIDLWLYLNNWTSAYVTNRAFRADLIHTSAAVFKSYFTLICWSWISGFMLGSLSRRTIPVSGALFCLVLFFAESVAAPQHVLPSLIAGRARGFDPNAAVFAVAFYRVMFPLIVGAVLVLLPALSGMRQGLGMAAFPLPLQIVLWTAAIAALAPIAIQSSSPYYRLADGWLPRNLPFLVYWPVAYLIASAIGRRWQAKAVSS